MRAAILARVSDESQAADDRFSIAAQLRVMRERCAREGWEVVAEFRAEGESAFTPDLGRRRVMGEIVAAAESGGFDVLVVHELGRFGRDEELGNHVMNRLERAGVRLVNASSGVDYHTAEGRLYFNFELGAQAYWSRKTSEHIRKSFAERHARGLPTGDVPFGYRRGESTDVAPVVVEEEAEWIRWAFAAWLEGRGYREIAERWNGAGLRPRSKVGYTRFTASSVQSVIENDFYAGFVRHRESRRPGAHEAIIAESTWADAQSRVRRFRRSRRFDTLLTGLARCVVCEGPIWTGGTWAKRSSRYYREPSHEQHRECANANTWWRSLEADGQVEEVVRGLGADERWLAEVERRARTMRSPDAGVVGELRARRSRVTTAYLAGALGEGEWRSLLGEVDGELSRLDVSPSAVLRAGEELRSFAQLWAGADGEWRRETVRRLFRAVWMDTRGRRLWVEPREEARVLFEWRVTGSTPDRSGGVLQLLGAVVYEPGVLLRGERAS